MVGDDWKDIMCGNTAGSGDLTKLMHNNILFYLFVVTVLLKNPRNCEHPSKAKPNFAVDSLHDIISLLQSTFTVKLEE